MAKTTEKDRLAAWDQRITDSTKNDYEPWAKEYECDTLEQFYYGHQHQEEDGEDLRRYVINVFYPAINKSKPSMLFSIPKYKVDARITRIDDPLSDSAARAKLQEDTLNTFAHDPSLGFGTETGLAILDAQFRMGVVQIGYTADYIDNPNAGKPILNDSQEAMQDADGNPVNEPRVKLKGEGLFIEWIPASHWRTSEGAGNRLKTADWCGYYKYLRVEDVKKNPRYKNAASLTASARFKMGKDEAQPDDESARKAGLSKFWFIWDIRSKARFVFMSGGEKFLLEEPFKFLPFADLKFNERLGKYYPLPPTYNWKHPQEQLNDMRNKRADHRGRAVDKYIRAAGRMTEEEFSKLTNGPAGTSVEASGDPLTAVVPLNYGTADPGLFRDEATVMDDFTRVSGVSGEQQQIAQANTATQSNFIELASQQIEAAKRLVVQLWLSEIGRIMLLTLRDHMALPFWIQMAIDPYSPLAQEEAMEVAHLWKQIVRDELGDIDNDITVDITSLSPIAREQEKANWLTFLGLVTNPVLGGVLSQSPMLLRKTAGLFDIHNERELKELSQAMQMVAMQMAQAEAAKAGVSLPQGPQGASPGPTPTNGAIGGQLAKQLPIEVAQGIQ